MGELVRLAKEALQRQRAIAPVTIQPGDQITWEKAGQAQAGIVDYCHVDANGNTWAFVTMPGGAWAAVNLKVATITTLEAAARPAQPKAVQCFACGGIRYWTSIHGATVCGTCHPPASPELVARWIDGTNKQEG